MEGGRGEEICEGGVTSALATPKCLACRRRGRRRFIGARPIKAWHRNTEQAIVNRELRPMMNDMVQHHPANAGNLRHREDCLAPRLQGPVLHHVCIARTRKRRPRFGCILVKLRQQLLPVFYFRRLIGRPLHRCVIEFFGLQRHADPARHRRDMSRQPPQSAGLFMGLPAPLLVRSALQYFPSVLHFLIEFWQHRLSHGHVVLLLSLNSEHRYLRRIKSEMSSLDSLAPRPHNPSLVAARLYPPHLNAWRFKIPVQRDEIYVTPERGITHYGSPVDHLSPRRFDRFVSLLQKTGERAIEQCPDEGLFRTLDGESNSLANIVKHMWGNMRSRWTDFLTTDGEKSDRNRDSEFVAPPATREALLALWEERWALVFQAIEPLSEADLGSTVTIRGE